MTTKEFESFLVDAIEAAREEREIDDDAVESVLTYADSVMLTSDRGLVVAFRDGSEIQVTLVLSRRGRGTDDEDEDDE